MKEIKFRVYDKRAKKMLNIDTLCINEEMFKPTGGDEYCVYGYDTKYYSDVMQYTGLEDKNGVEIYEYMEIDNFYEVSFLNSCYVLTNISNGDIIALSDYVKEHNGEIEVTREYTKI